MRGRLIWIGAACLALLAALFVLIPRLSRKLAPAPDAAPAARAGQSAVAPLGAPSPAQALAANAEEPSQLAVELNSPTGDVRADLRIINAVFVAYRGAVRSGNPVGENSEITAALTGRNKLGFAFIPKDCPAINAKGELCDRWGVPYFFHQISGEQMEIRSAGPDRTMWTPDDAVLTP
jgi:hypothetical protein